LLAMVDHLGAEGVRRIDLGAGGDLYKSHLADPETTVAIRLALSPVGRVYLLAAEAKHVVGRRLQAGDR
jgi:CelD/BcsL family acetyltransferase involved in cellulose biosynthesis